ncbi:uncharacterized protein LOC129302773 [Prosopis cineraria]|uniref:uncharacterized protein LOC129302773 n=1 Tax=Prosopis cineraria TaxID=364024 RepID=UPI00240F709B|nr:uncharacterized protein LOC129302773 [Prosopis cineraria]
MDDLVLTGSDDAKVQQVISLMSSTFSLKVLGELSFFLGVEFCCTDVDETSSNEEETQKSSQSNRPKTSTKGKKQSSTDERKEITEVEYSGSDGDDKQGSVSGGWQRRK